MCRFLILLTFGHHRIDFGFAQDVRPIVPYHRTVTDITENPYHPELGRKRLIEPSAVETDDFLIHGVVEFYVIVPVYARDLTKSSRSGVRVDVTPPLVMSNVSTFFVRSNGRAWSDDPHVLTQSSENVYVNVVRFRNIGIGPVDDETVLRPKDERWEPFHGTTLVTPSCSFQRTVV